MDDDLLQAYSRLSVHEYFLEVLYANLFVQMGEANAKELATGLRKNLRTAQIAPDGNQQAAELYGLEIAQHSAAMTERLLSKIEARAEDMKAELARQGSDP